MSSQIPNTPITPEAMARLTLDEQMAFQAATMTVAQDQKPSLEVIATLVLTVQRLITEAPGEIAAAERDRIACEIEASIVTGPERYGFWPCTCGSGQECFPHACHRVMNEAIANCGEDTWPVIVSGATWDAVEPLIRRDAASIARRPPGTPPPVPAVDPDCQAGAHGACLGEPCGCPVPGVHTVPHKHEGPDHG